MCGKALSITCPLSILKCNTGGRQSLSSGQGRVGGKCRGGRGARLRSGYALPAASAPAAAKNLPRADARSRRDPGERILPGPGRRKRERNPPNRNADGDLEKFRQNRPAPCPPRRRPGQPSPPPGGWRTSRSRGATGSPAWSRSGRRTGCRSAVLPARAVKFLVEDLHPRPLATRGSHDEAGGPHVRQSRIPHMRNVLDSMMANAPPENQNFTMSPPLSFNRSRASVGVATSSERSSTMRRIFAT